MKTFAELPLHASIQKSLAQMNYETPTDVQAKAIPLILQGRDVLVTAQTGTGKTAAFAIPMLQKFLEFAEANPSAPLRRALIVAPTRELAEQIGQVLRDLTFFNRRMRYAVVIGGSPYPKQLRELKADPVFVVGTPGRLIDHIQNKVLRLDNFDFLVLDEADRMLDMGFAPQMEMIVQAAPKKRQTMMFSATMPPEVKNIVASYLTNPARIAIGEENRPVSRIEQDVIELREGEKEERLIAEIDKVAGSIIVFTKTKVKADRVARLLSDAGHEADALHGDLTQGARRRVTNRFREEDIRILVATDIAARGLDIDHIRHVINYDLPMVPEDYIHRIGRTARAGKEGHSIAFVTPNERITWAKIQRMMGINVPRVPSSREMGRGAGARAAGRGSERPTGRDANPRGGARGGRDSSPYAKVSSARGESRGGLRSAAAPESRGSSRDESRSPRSENRPSRSEARPTRGDSRTSRGPIGKSARPRSSNDFNSAEARSIREEFRAREAAAAAGVGYDPRKAAVLKSRGVNPADRPFETSRPLAGRKGARGAGRSEGRGGNGGEKMSRFQGGNSAPKRRASSSDESKFSDRPPRRTESGASPRAPKPAKAVRGAFGSTGRSGQKPGPRRGR